MSNRLLNVAAPAMVALALASAPAFAAEPTADVHAYFERERERTDGHFPPSEMRAPADSPALFRADGDFLFQLARSDGNVDPAERPASRGPFGHPAGSRRADVAR